MRLDAGKDYDRQGNDSGAIAPSMGLDNKTGMNSAALAQVDVGLFRALRKLHTPKTRVCSALWLSYAEYDELSKLI